MTLPHTAYAEAVHTALAAAGMAPSEITVSVSETSLADPRAVVRDLSIAAVWDSGMRLTWQHTWGWRLNRPDRDGAEDLGLPLMVDPAVLVAPVRAALGGRSGADVPDRAALWEGHHVLDRRIADWEALPDPV